MKRYICDGIVKGATHVRNQMPCQDNKRIVEISDKIVIIAVADGHGSSKCPRSDRGSMIAVNSFYEVMKNYLKVYGEDEAGLSNLITFLNREGDMRFAQDVCEEWQARVKQSFYKNKVDGMTDEDGNIKWSSVFSLYGTTLLGMLVTDSFVFSFQIGDGDISVVTKDEVAPLVEPEKFLGTETHSLSKPDAWRKAVASVRRREMESEEPYMYILSTDKDKISRVIASHNILGVFAYHKAQCEGIAKALKVLLNAVDVKCIVVTGNSVKSGQSVPHAWNIVNIGEEPYQLDVTWDIGAMGQSKHHIAHDYFNLTDELMNQDHKADSSLPECKSKKANCLENMSAM